MQRKSILCLTSVIAASFCFGSAALADADFDAGVSAYHDGKYEDAVDCMLRVVERNPKNADAYFLMGQSREQLGKFAEAGKSYQYIIDNFPKSKVFSQAKSSKEKVDRAASALAAARAARAARVDKARSADRASDQHDETVIDIPFRWVYGKMIVEGQINGYPLEMHFDPSSSSCIFSSADAGIYELTSDSSERFNFVRGSGGHAVQAQYFNAAKLEVGEFRKDKVRVIVADMDDSKFAKKSFTMQRRSFLGSTFGKKPFPVLGRSFFGNSRYVVDNKKRVIHFYK